MKHALLLFALLTLPLTLRADEAGRRILAEVNFARQNPRAYAEVIARSGPRSRAAAEAVRFLRNVTPLPPLRFCDGLTRAAYSHVSDQGRRGGVGHWGNGGPTKRIERYGEWQGLVGENICYGDADARAIVMRLIIDEGVIGRGHRANLFSKTFRVAGIATGPHARYGEMCVMNFAKIFIPARSRSDQSSATSRFST